MTVSPGRSRSTRERWRDSSASKSTCPCATRSGAIVKRRIVAQLQAGPALDGKRAPPMQAMCGERGQDAVTLAVEEAAEDEGAAGRQEPAIARAEAMVTRR